jgi:hypothetical protein
MMTRCLGIRCSSSRRKLERRGDNLRHREGDLQAPKHLAGVVHDLYFNPKYEDFQPRTMWSLSNAFTSAFKELEPIPQFKATAKLGAFMETTSLTVV